MRDAGTSVFFVNKGANRKAFFKSKFAATPPVAPVAPAMGILGFMPVALRRLLWDCLADGTTARQGVENFLHMAADHPAPCRASPAK